MTLDPGVRLGNYEVLGPLGAGGMGEVYRARDGKLGREVAIKVLPGGFAKDPARLARFEREARMLASVNHPNLAAIYGLEDQPPLHFIVMELVEGETLGEKLSGGPLGIREALDLGRQIAEALEAAHEKGIVHRDLKPANVKVTPEGRAKVLDLGLAKAMDLKPDAEEASNLPTQVLDQTRPGVILGTIQFMSPEQARGKPVDKRTDIWAFGCVLFEMLSGRRAFRGETPSDTIASILASEPDWSALPRATPPRVRELIVRCLEKDPGRRLRDVGDARLLLEDSLVESQERRPGSLPGVEAPGRSWRRWLYPAVLLLLLGAGVFAGLRIRAGRAERALPAGKYLAVLPVRDLSDLPNGKAIGDGFAETLSARLARYPGIQVVSSTASVAAAERYPDAFEAGRSLGANLLLQTSLQQEGDRMRLTYAVWKLPGREQVSADLVEGSASDRFGVQDRLVQEVAASLSLPPVRPVSKSPGLDPAEQDLYLQALGHLQRYDRRSSINEGIRLLEALSGDRPSSALVQAALGRAYLYRFSDTRERRWFERAVAACERARSLDADLPDVDVTLGRLRSEAGETGQAIAAFQRALSREPNNYQALLGLATAYARAGQPVQAESTYRRAIRLQPYYWGGYSVLAAFYASRGEYPRAAETFRRVTELSPDSAVAYSNLGGIYALMGDFDRAREAYARSLSLDPTDTAYSNFGTVQFLLGRYRDAAASFERAVRLSSEHFQIWGNLAEAYRWGNEPAKAREAYEKSIAFAREELRINPRNGLVRSYLAVCLSRIGRLPEAEVEARRALSADSENPELLYNVAVVAQVAGRDRQALDHLRAAAAKGYSVAMIEREPEFASLRGRREFQALVRGSERKSVERRTK